MKTILKSSLAAVVLGVAALATPASAQVLSYAPNFDTFSPNFSLSGQDAWTTSDTNQSDILGVLGSYSKSPTDYVAAIGGIAVATPGVGPSSITTELYRPVDLIDPSNVSFSVDMGITNSSSPLTNRDSFAWTFRDGAGNLVGSVDFVPETQGMINTWQINFTNAVGVTTTSTFEFSADGMIHLGVNFSGLGTGTPTVGVSFAGYSDWAAGTLGPTFSVFNNVALAGATPSDIASAGATWKIGGGSPSTYGNNSLIFDNYNLASVPEPSAMLLLVIACGFVAVVAKRRFAKISA